MLRLVQFGKGLPATFICDPSASFQPGQMAQLVVVGNQIMATVSNGTAPIGVIDDIRTKAFTNVSWNERIVVPAIGITGPNNTIVTPIDIKAELEHPYIVKNSFVSSIKVALNPKNGIITFPAGTQLNTDLTGSGIPNAIKTIVNYTYQITNIPGDDSTLGSGRMTVWYDRMFFQTDQFETNQAYPVNQSIYVSEEGFLTSRKASEFHPAVGMVTAPPTPLNSMLEILFL